MSAEDGVTAAGRDLLSGQGSDGCRKLDRNGAEADANGSVSLLDVVDGEPGDRGGPLGIEEQQQAGEAVFGLYVGACRCLNDRLTTQS
ncbi:hypothetical protein [Streptomyces varsoviensis]|uniref:hypothetical protein n=1 Tax=Streptomyces varsoviensis TaxID=67373 RepID=UPI0012FED6EC|nr:hypothetical protein [Streptomyces varsoviensis]